jgi:protein-disulfide isomerase
LQAGKPAVEAVKEKYPQQVSVVHAHFPLSGHQYAFGAAIAAECAGRQGAFESYHNLLFLSQDRLGGLSYDSLATQVNIKNRFAFKRCLENKETAGIVESGADLAEELDVSSIPTFIINGTLVSGAVSEERLDGLVQEALAEAGK